MTRPEQMSGWKRTSQESPGRLTRLCSQSPRQYPGLRYISRLRDVHVRRPRVVTFLTHTHGELEVRASLNVTFVMETQLGLVC